MGELETPVTDKAAASTPGPALRPALRPVRSPARCAVAALALAAPAWAVRAVWHIRLARTGQPASGPPDQEAACTAR